MQYIEVQIGCCDLEIITDNQNNHQEILHDW